MPIEPPSDQPSGPAKRILRRSHIRLGSARDWLNVRRKRFWAVAFCLTYILAGYVLLPPIVRREIETVLHTTLERPVALDAVRMDPLAFSVDLRGLRISEKDGSPLLGFDRLHIRLSLASLPHWAWTFADIQLEGLTGSVVRYSETDSNIGRLIQTLDKAPPTAAPAPGLPRLVINHLRILNATASYTEQGPTHPFHTQVGPATVEISHLSTLPEKTGEQHIQIALEGGAMLEWTSTSGINPLVSAGHVMAKGPYVPLLSRYFADTLRMQAPTGAIAANLDYRLQARPGGGLGLAVEHISVAVNDLAVREQGAETPFLTVPEFRLSGGHLAWPEKKVGADTVSITGMTLAMRRQADGGIAPAPWAATAPQPSAPPAAAPPNASPATTSAPDWAVTLGKFEIQKARVRLEDRTLRQPTTLEITPVDLTVDTLSSQPDTAFPFSLALGVASGGQIRAQGRVTVLPDIRLDAKLAVSDLRLAAAQPYLHDLARLGIDDGRFNGESEVKIQGSEGLTLSGQGEVLALKVQDEVMKAPLLSWDRLAVDHYDYRQARNDLQISQVTIGGPYLRFQVAADQSTNFTHIMMAPAPVGATAPVPSARAGRKGGQGGREVVPTVAAPPASPASPMKVSVGRIVVTKGAADYGDASLPLPFSAHITDLQGEVATLTSATTSPTRVTLRGQVGEFGEATIAGSLTPFDPGKSSKINVLFRNVEFPGLSPYTVKFAGRRIARGRLDVDLRYAISDGKLNGANRVVIRDIELGQKLDVPGALNLPLELAIALLKDEDGKINVDLPVSGNLNDPQFDIGGVISQAVSNLLTNLISAPFEALAGLFGGGGDTLDHIDFAPGRAELDPPEREKILHLAQALAMRPHLALVVPGVMDPQADQDRLRLNALDARIAHDLGDRDTVKRQRQMLESLFEARVGKDQLPALKQGFLHPSDGQGGGGAATLDEAAYVAALRDRVAAAEPLAPTALADLAQARAAAVVDALKRVPGFDPQRVSLRGGATVHMGDDGTIPLKLDAESAGGGQ